MQHRNIPYTFEDGYYTGKYFNFAPYHIMSFSTELEQDMINQIDEYVDNREVYNIRRKLNTKAASEVYNTLTYKGD